MPRLCAQRLSASKEHSRTTIINCSCAWKCSTPVGIKGTFTPATQPHCPQFVRCSTPVGIKGTFTIRNTALTPKWGVLNACRHQRNIHARVIAVHSLQDTRAQRLSASKEHSHRYRATTNPAWECSTPVGIKGTFTQRIDLYQYAGQRCSTPVGIKGTFTN